MKNKQPRAKDMLRDLGVVPTKQRGQNFIIDPNVLQQIIEFGSPKQGDHLVEIGPGLGALTEKLVLYDANLVVVEIEEQFCRPLKEKFPSIQVHQGDVRQVDFSTFGTELIVFGNLPYSFSTEIIFHLLDQGAAIKRAVLMLQREFAERVAAAPGSRTYGAISVNAQMRADVRLGGIISGESFHPRANVESILLELKILEKPRFQIENVEWFRRVVQAAFLQRRKKLKNSLLASGIFSNQEGVQQVLEMAQIDPGIRAEALTIEEFARLAKYGLIAKG